MIRGASETVPTDTPRGNPHRFEIPLWHRTVTERNRCSARFVRNAASTPPDPSVDTEQQHHPCTTGGSPNPTPLFGVLPGRVPCRLLLARPAFRTHARTHTHANTVYIRHRVP